ncbi:hypothetical protein KI387_009357, partial [Taxus chinensis]
HSKEMGNKKQFEPESNIKLMQDEFVVEIFENTHWLQFLQLFKGFKQDMDEDFNQNFQGAFKCCHGSIRGVYLSKPDLE